MKTSKGEREIWTARSRVTERKKGLKIKIEWRRVEIQSNYEKQGKRK
jgi:hypothetical protein